MDIELKIGDIVVDVVSNDVGLLIKRYRLFEPFNENGERTYEDELNVYAWEIFWVGATDIEPNTSRYQPYTESGLYNLIKTGTFLLGGYEPNE